MDYPTPLYDTEDEYRTAALLLEKVVYLPGYHVFASMVDMNCYCPDTMEVVYTTTPNSSWTSKADVRKTDVKFGWLGPRNNLNTTPRGNYELPGTAL